jgi:hypothetical protein
MTMLRNDKGRERGVGGGYVKDVEIILEIERQTMLR